DDPEGQEPADSLATSPHIVRLLRCRCSLRRDDESTAAGRSGQAVGRSDDRVAPDWLFGWLRAVRRVTRLGVSPGASAIRAFGPASARSGTFLTGEAICSRMAISGRLH